MGFELKMYFGTTAAMWLEEFRTRPGQDGVWISEAGYVDLRKPGCDSELFNIIPKCGDETLPVQFYRDVKNRDFEVDEDGVRSAEPFNEEHGEEKVYTDKYSTKMELIDAYVALAALVLANKQCVKEDGTTYRRYDIAIAALKTFIERFDPSGSGHYGDHEVPVVYFYGH